MAEIIVYPLNNIYAYSATYLRSSEHIDYFSQCLKEFDSNNDSSFKNLAVDQNLKTFFQENKKFKTIQYVEKTFLCEMKKSGNKLSLVANSDEELEVIKIEIQILNLQDYFNNIYKKDNLPENIILISEELWNYKFLKSNSLFFYSSLIFKGNNNILELQKQNIDVLLEYKPHFAFEAPRQLINIINYINNCNDDLPIETRLNNYLLNCLKVLYFIDTENYRKREAVVTCDKIHFIPIVTKSFGDIELNGKFDLFLQRAPYFYLSNKDRAKEIEKEVIKTNAVVLHSFDIIEHVFYRFQVYEYIESFCQIAAGTLKEKYDINLKIPKTIPFNINSTDSKEEIRANLIKTISNIGYPLVVKPDPCSEHDLFMVLSEEGLCQFIDNNDKLYKYNKYILQEFIPHDGIMFKTYLLNGKVTTITRPSLPNLEGKNLELKHFENKCMKFHNEYLYAKEDKEFFDSIEINTDISKLVNYEAFDYITKLFCDIQGITMFGLDFLYDVKRNTYYILEINYFPSYRELGASLESEMNEHIISYFKAHKTN
jgi:hypothetical protein